MLDTTPERMLDYATLTDNEREFVDRAIAGRRFEGPEHYNPSLDSASATEPIEIAFWRLRLQEEEELEGVTDAEQAVLDEELENIAARLEEHETEKKSSEIEISAKLIQALLFGQIEKDGNPVEISFVGIAARRIRITGALNLDRVAQHGGGAMAPLALESCNFEQAPSLRHAKIGRLSLSNSVVPSLGMRGARVHGELRLDGLQLRTETREPVQVDLRDTVVEGALFARRLRRARSQYEIVVLLESARIEGKTIITGTIESDLPSQSAPRQTAGKGLRGIRSQASELDNPTPLVLDAPSAQFGGEVDLSQTRFWSINLSNANVGSQVVMFGSRCESAPLARTYFDKDRNLQSWVIDLSFARIKGSLDCRGISSGAMSLRGIEAGDLRFVPRINPLGAEDKEVKTRAAAIDYWLTLDSARIRGDVDLSGCRIGRGSAGDGVSADGAQIDGNLFAYVHDTYDDWSVKGSFDLTGADIGGSLMLLGGTIDARGGTCIIGQHLKVGGNILLIQGAKSSMGEANASSKYQPLNIIGKISVLRASIGGALAIGGGVFGARPDVPLKDSDAIDFSMSRIGSGIFMRAEIEEGADEIVPGTKAYGTVRFHNCVIGALFDARGAELNASGKGTRACTALELRNASVDGQVLLGARMSRAPSAASHPFKATGAVDLDGIRIQGDLECDGGIFDQGVAMSADEESPSTESGDTRLRYTCFSAVGADIKGRVLLGCRESSTLQTSFIGTTKFDNAQIGRDLVATGASLVHRRQASMLDDESDAMLALSLHNTRVLGDLVIEDEASTDTPFPKREGIFDLSGASVRMVRDRQGRGWCNHDKSRFVIGHVEQCPAFHNIRLKLIGFNYSGFDEQGSASLQETSLWDRMLGRSNNLAQERLRWLERQLPDLSRRRMESIKAVPKDSPYSRKSQRKRRPEYFFPQTYEQAERAFADAGRLDVARELAIKKAGLGTHLKVFGLFGRLSNRIDGFLFGHGYGRWWALGAGLMTLALLWALIGQIISHGYVDFAEKGRGCSDQRVLSVVMETVRPALGLVYPNFRNTVASQSCTLIWWPAQPHLGAIPMIAVIVLCALTGLIGLRAYQTIRTGYRGPPSAPRN